MEQVFLIPIQINEFKELIKQCVKSELDNSESSAKENQNPDDLISIQEVQKLLSVSKVTIHKWKNSGLLPYHKLNRRLYFKKQEVLNSLKYFSNTKKLKR